MSFVLTSGPLQSQDPGANSNLIRLYVAGHASIGIQLSGTWAGRVEFEGSADGIEFKALNLTPIASTTAAAFGTSNAIWAGSCGALMYVQARCSTFTSGRIDTTIIAALAGGSSSGGSGGGGGGGDASAANQLLEIADLDKLVAQIADFDTSGSTALTPEVGILIPGNPPVAVSSTNPMPVNVSQVAGVTATQPTLESGRVPINTISGQAGVAGGDGAVGATTQRVTVASDRLGTVLEITPVMDTSIYATGDVAFIPIEITNAAHHINGSLEVRSLVALDEDDQGVAITVYFQKDNSSMGAVNAAFAPTDTNARAIIGKVAIGTGDWEDLGANRLAVMDNVGQKFKADSNGSLWISGAIRSGTPTFTASGLKLKIGVAWD